MSVTTFDGTFSFRQDTLQRLGHRQPNQMSDEQREKFKASPFMQQVQRLNENAWERTLRRDEKRKKTDPTFQPKDSDFNAPKAFEYNKNVNYYKVLGVDEYAPLDEVKKAYKKLSLIYHPDKTHGKTQEEKDEYAAIFIEIKNAYQTLGDNPTRRQYDKERDSDLAGQEVNGWKVKEAPSFDAEEMLKKLQENMKPPGKTVTIPVQCKLEKFVFGGLKGIRRTRIGKGGTKQDRFYRMDILPGSADLLEATFRSQGDWHEHTMNDHLLFQLSPKPHPVVVRDQGNLRLRADVRMRPSMLDEPYISVEVPSVRGRHTLLWGVNPFWNVPGSNNVALNVTLKGQGVSSEGSLSFTCRVPGSGSSATTGPSTGEAGSAGSATSGAIIVCVTNLATEAKMYLEAESEGTTIGELQKKASDLLGLGRGSRFRLLNRLEGGRGLTPFPERQPLGNVRSMVCGGVEFKEIPMSAKIAETFLKSILDIAASRGLQDCYLEAMDILPRFGYKPEKEELEKVIERAMQQLPRGPSGLALRSSVSSFLKAPPGSGSRNGNVRVKGERRFLQRFKLAPPTEVLTDSDNDAAPDAAAAPASASDADPSLNPRMQRRIKTAERRSRTSEVELFPMGQPVTLFTRPTCTITVLSTAAAPARAKAGNIVAGPMLAVTVNCEACSSKKAAGQWELLLNRIAPVLHATVFKLLRPGRAILPRPLSDQPCYETYDGIKIASGDRPMPWKRMAQESFKKGEFFTACSYYEKCLEDEDGECKEDDEARAVALSNRSACLAMLGHYREALDEAKKSQELRPQWAKAWSRAGFAASKMQDDESQEEANRAYCKAVELDPCQRNVDALAAVAGSRRSKMDPAVASEFAHADKERGNIALRNHEYGLAVALYTRALGLLGPRPQTADADPRNAEALLRTILLSDRAAALSSLKQWQMAVVDAKEAVEIKGDFHKARTRLGVAYLGAGQCEKAYYEFAMSLAILEAAGKSSGMSAQAAIKGREASMGQLPSWRSVPAMARFRQRFYADVKRPAGSSRVFAISDLRFDYKRTEEWVHNWDGSKFREDVLIVAGNLCSTKGGIARALHTLKQKFRRVFYIPGDAELQLSFTEVGKYTDCLAKLLDIYEVCDEYGVDIFPAAVSENMFILPLMSWHDPEFDVNDPYPDPQDTAGNKWPMDPDRQLWKFMLKLNEAHLRHPYHSTVITASHFLPRCDLPFPPNRKTVKTTGCEGLDMQIRQVDSKVHVYGHSRFKHHNEHHGILYVNRYHGTSDEAGNNPTLCCIHDGHKSVRQELSPLPAGEL